MSRAEYVWGAKQYLASFEKGEVRVYDEYREGFPWRSLASISCQMSIFGMKFRFKTHRGLGYRTIERIL